MYTHPGQGQLSLFDRIGSSAQKLCAWFDVLGRVWWIELPFFWGFWFVPLFHWLSAVRLVFFWVPNPLSLAWIGPCSVFLAPLSLCMPSEVSEEVAADSSATHTPVSNPEGLALVEEVEQTAPLTTSVGPGGVASWADASEVDSPELPAASTSGTQVKEEERQEAESISAVLGVLGVPEEVADEPVATEEPVETKAESAPLGAELAPGEIAAEAAFTDLDRAKEETADDPASSPSEPVEVETTDLLGLDDTEPTAVGEPALVEPSPTVADPAGVATEATTADTSDLVPPPTSPNLVEPGTEPVRVGHSPAASSREPRRQRHRGFRGGQTTRWQEALREWWLDFEKVQRWLYNNSGGSIARGFWLERVSLEDVDSDEKWFVCNFHLLQDYLTTSQLLALAYHIWPQYTEWAHSHGLDRRRGVSHGKQVIDSKILPPQSEINLNILGVEYPPDDFWDRYYRYQAPHAKPRPKGKAAAPSGGAAGAKGPKQPDHPPPQPAKNPASVQKPKSGWIPTLRSADHPVVPAASATVAVASGPVPVSATGVAASGRDSAATPVAPSPAAPPAKPRPVTTSAPASTPGKENTVYHRPQLIGLLQFQLHLQVLVSNLYHHPHIHLRLCRLRHRKHHRLVSSSLPELKRREETLLRKSHQLTTPRSGLRKREKKKRFT